MVKRLFKAAIYICLSIFLFTTTIFSEVASIQAVQIKTDDNVKNKLGIVIEDSNEEINNLNKNDEIDLGDDQTFPFIAGFGKN